MAPVRGRHEDGGDRLRGVPVLLGIAHEDLESTDALEDLAGGLASDRSPDDVLHLLDVDSPTGHRLAIHPDEQLRGAGDLIGLDVGRAANLANHGSDLVRLFLEHLEIVAEELDGELGANALEQLVDRHLDRLREVREHARNLSEVLPDDVLELGLGVDPPLLLGLEEEVHLGAVHRVGMGADLATADPGNHRLHLRKLHQLPLDPHAPPGYSRSARSTAPW